MYVTSQPDTPSRRFVCPDRLISSISPPQSPPLPSTGHLIIWTLPSGRLITVNFFPQRALSPKRLPLPTPHPTESPSSPEEPFPPPGPPACLPIHLNVLTHRPPETHTPSQLPAYPPCSSGGGSETACSTCHKRTTESLVDEVSAWLSLVHGKMFVFSHACVCFPSCI